MPTMSDDPTHDASAVSTDATQQPPPARERAITIPALSLVVLVGASGSGKSTFAARHFLPTEVLNSDHYRGVVGDDPNDQTVTAAAFDALHHIAGLRLALGRLTVIDATSVKPQDRAALVHLAREHDVLPVAIVLNLDERVCRERNANRPDRQLPPHVIHNHVQQLRRGLRGLEREGFRGVHVLDSPAAVEAVRIVREPLFNDKRAETGPFDIIGDLHGCFDELLELLGLLGYVPDPDAAGMRHPDGRRAIFLGDLADRGPHIVETITLVRRMVAAGTALCVPGNHDVKLARHLAGRNVRVTHGFDKTIAQIAVIPDEEREQWMRETRAFLDGLISHYVLDGGGLVVAHAGMKQAYQGRASGRVREFALYGETTGESDEFGLPVRANWAADYRGSAVVVYGHTPIPGALWLNNTINIDTGCVFGGALTALRWPERELVAVPARAVYAEPLRPLVPDTATHTSGKVGDTLLRIEDVQGKQIVQTRLAGNVIVEADRAAAALEVMSRFALDPRWLIYLPPTMSPSETSPLPDWLEHPAEACAYYRENGVPRVVCEEKHMGSRAVLVLCRDAKVAARRFGVADGTTGGVCYTRTGRQFFEDDALNRAFIAHATDVLTRAGLWERLATDWVCLDAEIMPWSAKARGLIREQYAPVAAAGASALDAALRAAESAAARGVEGVAPLLERLHAQRDDLARYAEAYGRYCWETDGLAGVRVAPFHLLAADGATYLDRDHLWHMAELARLAEADELFLATQHRAVNPLEPEECEAAVAWWEELTAAGGEGMVVKPLEWVVRGPRGVVQPAIKCRGREYLRIIYGPDYTLPEHLARLKRRGLGAKRALALREFALGVEALERFVRREPLWRVHQAVFGVLALESEPVDPRL